MWRLAYMRDLLDQWGNRSYWSMSARAREARRARLRQRHEPLVLTGEAAARAEEILARRGKP